MEKTGKKLIIFGTGNFGEVAHFYFTKDSEYEVVAFSSTKDDIKEDTFKGLSVVPFEEIEKDYPPEHYDMFIAVGYIKVNKTRKHFYELAKVKGYKLVTYISSKLTHWGDTIIGDNCFIFEDNTIQPFVKIGNNVTLWSGNHIGHHVKIGSHCFISSHVVLSGNVEIGECCFVGVNATFRDNIKIAPECIIGAGALILRNTKEKEVYAARNTDLFPKTSDRVKM